MSAQFEVNDLADSDIDDTEEALITTLELALIKDLDGYDRRVLDGAAVYVPSAQKITKNRESTHTSKFSFQYGLRVFLMTLVVWVCSVSTVITANGSGRRKTSRLARPSAATTDTEDKYRGEIRAERTHP